METPATINEATLFRYFSGNLTPEEKQAVDCWLDESEENKKLAKDVYYLYFSAETLAAVQSANAPAALARVKKRIRRPRISWRNGLQRAAAILFIPLLLSTLYFRLKEEPRAYVEYRTNPGMVAAVDLPDGSKVWLNSETCFRHPVKFSGKLREVELDGEAYFSVQKNRGRFVVHTPHQVDAEVLGTEFNIEAYKTGPSVTTTLVSGSVKLSYQAGDNREASLIMHPEEKAVYSRETRQVEVSKPYIPTQIAWKDGVAIFRNTPFREVLHILSKRFNVDFRVKNEALYDNSFTGPFEGQHLQLILEHLRLSSGIRYKFLDPEAGEGKAIREKIVVELY